MPGYKDFLTITGFKSKNAVWKLIRRLAAKGFLSKDKDGKITLAKESEGVPFLGLVEAGFPTPAEETNLDYISLDEWIINDRSSSFMLKVKGDSMKDAGIINGDYVIVERKKTASVGDIIIAEIDGAWTMKYLRKDIKGYYLEAANRSYKPIRPRETLNISAVIKAVVRKYLSR